MLNEGMDSLFCPLCFRVYENNEKNWIQHPIIDIQEFIREDWTKPPYQNIIEQHLYSHKQFTNDISVCFDCTNFIKKKGKRKQDDTGFESIMISKNLKHPMHVFYDFIISGGCTLRPSLSVLIHCIDSVLYKFPDNPILNAQNRSFLNMMSSIQAFTEMFALSIYDVDEYLCALRWAWCGSQKFLTDPLLAKLMRRYSAKYPGHEQWLNTCFPSACRHCGPITLETECLNPSGKFGYDVVLFNGANDEKGIDKKIMDGLLAIEAHDSPIEYVSMFCAKCCRLSPISFSYDYIIKKRMKVPSVYGSTEDARTYYCRLIHEFRDTVKE